MKEGEERIILDPKTNKSTSFIASRCMLPLMTQKGIFRINDLDCVDETNVMMAMIGQDMLIHQLKCIGIKDYENIEKLEILNLQRLGDLWADNGDAISKSYTGTNALYGHWIRYGKIPFFLYPLSHVYINLSRYYLNTLVDYIRQDDFDFFLGKNSNVDLPDIDNAKLQVYVRRRLSLKDLTRSWYVAWLLMLRKMFAPLNINTTFEFLHAMFWLGLFYFYWKVLRVPTKHLIRKPRANINVSTIYSDLKKEQAHGKKKLNIDTEIITAHNHTPIWRSKSYALSATTGKKRFLNQNLMKSQSFENVVDSSSDENPRKIRNSGDDLTSGIDSNFDGEDTDDDYLTMKKGDEKKKAKLRLEILRNVKHEKLSDN
jgi:hypothetical protein